MLLQLRPGLPSAWRGPGRLQLGLDERAVVLEGLSGAEESLLSALDGTLDLAGVLALARRLGVHEARARELVRLLAAAHLLVPARTPRHRLAELPEPVRRRSGGSAAVLGLAHPGGDGWDVLTARARATVVVVGASGTGLAVALGLAAAGIGTVVVEDGAAVTAADVGPGRYAEDDVGRPRAERAARRLTTASPGTRTSLPPGTEGLRPDLVVLVASGALDPSRTEPLVREGVPHLPVLWRGAGTVVGPLVRPGASTCLRCVDLHRTDRDPEWPRLVAQLSGATPGAGGRPEEASLSALAAALACVQALAQVDGVDAPAALDATLEVSLPRGAVAARPWSPHPLCGCTWVG